MHGLPNLSADGIDQERWTRNFAIQFWQGEWYPRWLSGTNGGLGSPAFFFYPSLVSYGVGALFRPIFSDDPSGWMIAGWSAAVAGILAGLAAYFWLRDMTDAESAFFGALVYVISPYRIAIDLYNRGALSEFWAFVWMPLVLWALSRCIKGGGRAVAGLALSYGLLAITHLPTVVCFSWVIPLALWLMTEPGERFRAFVRTGAGIALGVALAAIFLLPALFDQHKSWIADLVTSDPWFYYRNNFLFIKIVSLLDFRMRVLVVVLSMAAASGLCFWLGRRFETDQRRRRLAVLYALVSLISLVMMTHLAIPVYELVKFAQTIQFPTRFASSLTVGLAALCALVFPLRKRPTRWMTVTAVVVFATIWISADAWSGAWAFSVWRKVPAERLATDQQRVRLQAEYYQFWPKPADPLNFVKLSALQAFIAAHPAHSTTLSATGATAVVENWRPRLVTISLHAPECGWMTIGHFYYRDWRAHIQGSGQSLEVRPSPEGLIQVETPRGDYTLELQLVRDPAERTGMWVSALSAVVIAGLFLGSGKPKTRLPEVAE